ncbi:hypothetical protein [Salininema proteolyticum]|uniref:PH domain-containing protein n=1 Tax=Salininema proteolyticum TaxID=1607685 RepID=A0ABV8TT41_9ACTN
MVRSKNAPGTPEEIRINDLPAPGQWAVLAYGLAVVIAGPQAFLLTGDFAVWAYTGAGLVILLLPPLAVFLHILKPRPAVRLDARGVKLARTAFYTSGKHRNAVHAKWDDVERVVVWRERVSLFGISGWSPRVGVVTANTKDGDVREGRSEADLRENGVPVWLAYKMGRDSVRLSPKKAREVAWAVAKVAPHIDVVDERIPGRFAKVTA